MQGLLLLLLLLCCQFLVITVSTAAVQATMFIGQSILAFAVGSTPARTGDFYYLPGVAVGGSDATGGIGGDGYCAAGRRFDPLPSHLVDFPFFPSRRRIQ